MVNRKSITYVFVSFTPRSGIFFEPCNIYSTNPQSLMAVCLYEFPNISPDIHFQFHQI